MTSTSRYSFYLNQCPGRCQQRTQFKISKSDSLHLIEEDIKNVITFKAISDVTILVEVGHIMMYVMDQRKSEF